MTKPKLQTFICVVVPVASALIAVFAILGNISPQVALSDAAWHGDTRRARLALILGADINSHPGGCLPNIVAAGEQGQVEMLEFLLAHGAPISTQDKFGGTALLRAAQNGHSQAVDYLLNHGADPNTKDKEGGNTAMDYALRNNEYLITLLKMSGATSKER
jgi:hypothetical protein